MSGEGQLVDSGAAEEFEEEDHFVVLIGAGGRGPHLLETGDFAGEFGAGTGGGAGSFEDTGAEVFGDELQLVGGESGHKAADSGAGSGFGTGHQRGDQVLTSGNHIQRSLTGRIIAKSHTGRKGRRVSLQ